MNPEVGQIWWLSYADRSRSSMVPALLVAATVHEVGLPLRSSIKFDCINLINGDSFIAWSTRWQNATLASFVGERIA